MQSRGQEEHRIFCNGSGKALDSWIYEKHGISERYELDRYIKHRLKVQIRYAKERCSWYHEHIPQEDGRLFWQWWETIPFTYPEDIIEHGQDMVCIRDSSVARIVTLETSGTSGKPKRIFFSQRDLENTIDYFDHGMRVMADKGDVVYITFAGGSQGSLVSLLSEGLERLGASVSSRLDEEATILIGAPEEVLDIVRQGLVTGTKIQKVLLSSSYVKDETVEEIKKAWNCRVFEHYGMTEMGLGCAVSCGEEGYHIRENDIYIEIVNPETGEILPEGEWGEICFTGLNREAMPLIRYRTGDISRIIPEPCSCGSMLRRLDKVKERKDGR